jgi:hypothetical protein
MVSVPHSTGACMPYKLKRVNGVCVVWFESILLRKLLCHHDVTVACEACTFVVRVRFLLVAPISCVVRLYNAPSAHRMG